MEKFGKQFMTRLHERTVDTRARGRGGGKDEKSALTC